MDFYDEEKFKKWRNILTVTVLGLLAVLLFFKVYVYFEKSVQIITGTLFPFILSFVIVYSLMPFIDILNENFKINRKVAISLVLLIFFIFFIYVILAFIPLVAAQLSSLIEFFIKNQENFQKEKYYVRAYSYNNTVQNSYFYIFPDSIVHLFY